MSEDPRVGGRDSGPAGPPSPPSDADPAGPAQARPWEAPFAPTPTGAGYLNHLDQPPSADAATPTAATPTAATPTAATPTAATPTAPGASRGHQAPSGGSDPPGAPMPADRPAGLPASAADDVDPLFPGQLPSWQPRIIPSPPPQRGRLIVGLLVGLLAGLVVFGGVGFGVGRWTADEPSAAPPAPAPTPTPTLPAYERTQRTLNEAKFGGDLATMAEPWLPWISGCLKNGDPGGPPLNPGESSRVLCEYGSMTVYFVQYVSIAERDKIRIRNLGQNVDATTLAPGALPGEQAREAPSGRTKGGYVEYAYRAGAGPSSRVVSALWWDDADAPVGAFLLAFWADGVGESWGPMRDVWARHA